MPRFEALFSGLCAYVPNCLPGTDAASWSVLLYNLEKPFAPENTAISISPHFPVLVYRTDHFKVVEGGPRIRIFDEESKTEHGVIHLNGKRVDFKLPGARRFSCDVRKPDQPEKGPKDAAEGRRAYWIPDLETLLPGSGILVPNGDEKLFNTDGFPNESKLSAHVLLRQGRLETHLLAPPLQAGYCNIWSFRQQIERNPPRHTQAVAYQTALVASTRIFGATVTISDFFNNNTVLKQRCRAKKATIRIENYEFEEIVRWAQAANIGKDQPDPDFDLMNYLAGCAAVPERCIPYFKETNKLPYEGSGDGGAGTMRRTCGGARYLSFPNDYKDILPKWE